MSFHIEDSINAPDNSLCTSLSHDSQNMTPNQHNGLCVVCQTVDFVSLTSEACQYSYTKSHFHVGALKHIARKTFCPGCRLIISATKSTDRSYDKFGESTITLGRRFISALNQKSGSGVYEIATDGGKLVWVHMTLPMESFIEVSVDGRACEHRTIYPPRVIGIIVRAAAAESVQSSALKRSEVTGRMFDQSLKPFCVRGRDVPPKVNMNLVKHWMQSCSAQHDRCRIPTLSAVKEHTIRLIDTRDYRVVSATSRERYAALSYVWGSETTPLLTRDTLSDLSTLDGLRNLTIPQTIIDAIRLVRDLDERYLWVDSLCIVQDDNEEKQEQLPIMADIYSYAELVIVAAAGSDANSGLPGIWNTSRSTSQRTEEINGVRFITAYPAVRQVLDWSVWNSRGWTLQETVHSRRALVFTEDIVYWNCLIAKCREDLSCESSSAALRSTQENLLPGFLFETGQCRIGKYCQLIQAFSRRKLREESDVIWALVGLLRSQASDFPKGFIWGLPYEILDDTLLWSEDSNCPSVHKRNALHTVVTRRNYYDLSYPTWSWLSVGKSVSFQHDCKIKVVSRVIWGPPTMKLADQGFATFPDPINPSGSSNAQQSNPSISLLARSSSAVDIMDYGPLIFLAQTALLLLKRAYQANGELTGEDGNNADEKPGDESSQKPPSPINYWVEATVHCPVTGEKITRLKVPVTFFNGNSERLGELVLLSTNFSNTDDLFKPTEDGAKPTDKIRWPAIHKDGCRCPGSHNVMLIEWDGAVAYRRTIGTVRHDHWMKVESQWQVKMIVLG